MKLSKKMMSPRLEMARESGEHIERGAEKVRVEMDHQAAGEIVAVDEGQQRVLKQPGLERAARIAAFPESGHTR